jgi:hypothetical protein
LVLAKKNLSRQGRTIKHWLDISMLEGRMSRPEQRRWWWPGGLMRAKAPTMSRLGGSSLPRVVQGLFLLLLTIMYLLFEDLL